MTLTHRQQKTILVVNNDLAVLVLMRGILQNEYRVLLAADADSAVRLFEIGVSVDLAVIDRNLTGSQPAGLEQRMKEISPKLRILWMAGFVEKGLIRLKASDASRQRISESLIQRIASALTGEEAKRDRADVSTAELTREAPMVTRKVMVAGKA